MQRNLYEENQKLCYMRNKNNLLLRPTVQNAKDNVFVVER